MLRTALSLIAVGALAVATSCGSEDTATDPSAATDPSTTLTSTTDATTTTTTTTSTSTTASAVSSSTTIGTTGARADGLIRLSPEPGLVDVDRSSAVDDLTERLGAPSQDTGWLPMPPTLACTGNLDYRSVQWGDLRIVVERRTDDAEPYLTGWSLGPIDIPLSPERATDVDTGAAIGATTTDGIGLGDPVSDITEAKVQRIDDSTWLVPVAAAVLIETDANQRIVGLASGRLDCIGLDITHLPCERPVPVSQLPNGSSADDVTIENGTAAWSPEDDDGTNTVSEQLGGLSPDDALARNAASGPTQSVSGDTTVSAIPVGDLGVGGWTFYVFDMGTPCVRVLRTPAALDVNEARTYADMLAADLNPQL